MSFQSEPVNLEVWCVFFVFLILNNQTEIIDKCPHLIFKSDICADLLCIIATQEQRLAPELQSVSVTA